MSTVANPAAGRPVPATAPTPTGTERAQAPWLTVMVREILVKVTDKTFIVSTLLTLLLLVGSTAAGAWFGGKAEHTNLAVVGAEGEAVGRAMDAADKAANDKNEVVLTAVADVAAGEALLRDGSADALLAPRDGGGWELVAKQNVGDHVMQLAQQTISQLVLSQTAEKAGTDVGALTAASTVSHRSLEVEGNRGMIARIAGMAFGILFLMSAMTYGLQIASSVIEEKQSRVVEILVATIPVRHLLAGKVLGNTIMALAQMALLVVVGLVGLSLTPLKEMMPVLGGALGWFLVLFVVGFLALACVWAAAGALGTRSEDVQYTSQPLMYVMMACYVAGFAATGMWRTVLSFVPVVSTILMPVRVVEGTAHWWELVIALVLNLLFAVGMVRLGETVYRRALLRTQGRLSFRQALAAKD